jgi:hypothetical protein
MNDDRARPAGTWRALALAVGLVLAGKVGPGVASAGSAPPTAAQVLDAYVEVTGGKAAYSRIDNRVTRGRMELAGQNIEMRVTIWAARPNETYLALDSDITGPVERGTTGDLVWENSAMTGPQIKEGAEKAQTLREARFDRWVEWRDVYGSVEYAGVEDIDGRPAHKIIATPVDGRPETLFFDPESGLLLRLDLTLDNAMGSFPIRTRFDDYREVDGLVVPFGATTEVMGQRMKLVAESIQHNVELPPHRFDPPQAVRELLKSRSASDAGGASPAP